MNLATRSRRFVAALGAAVLGAFALAAAAVPASAQEIAESHLAAARSAVAALGATEEFDVILPGAAQALKTELIQKNPDLQALIIEIVDRTAITLAARRGDLEREAATIYARTFSETQLNEVAAFYNSETGKKLLADSPIVIREIYGAADIWQRGIARDLARQVAEELGKRAEIARPQQSETPAAETPDAEGAAQPQ